MLVCIWLRSINEAVIGFMCGGKAVIKRVSISSAIMMPVRIYDADLKLILSTYGYLGSSV